MTVILAVDSIPAIFAVTTDPFIVLDLKPVCDPRPACDVFPAGGRSRQRFSTLKYGLAVILRFIGIKMLIVDFYHIPIAVSLGLAPSRHSGDGVDHQRLVNYRHDKQRGG
ncbi:hypothetical protein ACLK1S_19190 [Escherichia coli]